MKTSLLLLILPVALLGQNITQLDSYLSNKLQGSNRYPVWDYFMEGIALSSPIIELGAVGNYINSGTYKPRAKITYSILATGTFTFLIKYGLKRKRPARHYKPRLMNTRMTPSFPSGHMAFTSAVVTCLLEETGYSTSLGVGWLVLSGWSQVYTGNHYLSDVIAGYLLGSIVAKSVHHYIENSKPQKKTLSVTLRFDL